MIYLICNKSPEEPVLNKKLKLSRIILFGLIFPLAGEAILSLAFCLFQKNYYYLPRGLDFLIRFFYDAKYIFLYIALFFFAGMTTWMIAFATARDAVMISIMGVVFTAVLPAVSFLMTFLLLRSTDAALMETYLYTVALCALENVARYVICVVVAWIVKAVYGKRETASGFEKPYVVPRGVIGLPLIISLSAWLLMTVFGVIFSSVTENPLGTIIYESSVCIGGYFVAILGAFYSEKKLVK